MPQLQFIDRFVDEPVQKQRQASMTQNVQKTVEVPQIQGIEKVVEVPVQKQRQVPMIQTVQKTVHTFNPNQIGQYDDNEQNAASKDRR